INTLIIAGPKETFSERQKYVVDQFIMRGGEAIFLLNGVNINDSLQAVPNDTGLD
ncbi:hypothetical protein COT95_02105, partial [Candidatus Falkowbacteria bacterium CG10_big_fil_rev_8_21_14_0_10_37_6]